jgi:hypothetical protein
MTRLMRMWFSIKVIRCLAEFEFGFEGFGDGELSDAGESVEEEYARW